MKSNMIACRLLLVACMLMLVSCTKGVDSDRETNSVLLCRSIEADEMAIWLSGELYPPPSLAGELCHALELLRDAYSDSIPVLSTQFRPRHCYSKLLIAFIDSALAEYKAGNYHAWDSLNALYEVESIRVLDPGTGTFVRRLVDLTFSQSLHVALIQPFYEALPGVMFADLVVSSDWHNLYPWVLGDTLTFLLRQVWGDCPSICANHTFWYFRVARSQVEFVGEFTPTLTEEPPVWWDEAVVAFCAWCYGAHPLCEEPCPPQHTLPAAREAGILPPFIGASTPLTH